MALLHMKIPISSAQCQPGRQEDSLLILNIAAVEVPRDARCFVSFSLFQSHRYRKLRFPDLFTFNCSLTLFSIFNFIFLIFQ